MMWQNPVGAGSAWPRSRCRFSSICSAAAGARVLRFPSLRFLGVSRLLPTRRTRLQDLLLLAVRVAIFALAVAALAQPLWLSARRSRARNGALARVVIVDTSFSMQRAAVAGGKAIDAARRSAKILADSASPAMVVESAAPAAMVAGAADWLARQPARGEIAIVSDFQLNAVDDGAMRAIPASIGVRLVRIAVVPGSDTAEMRLRAADGDVVARSAFAASGTATEWSAAPHTANTDVVQLLAGESERAATSAAERAAQSIGGPSAVDSTHRVAIVYPGYAQRGAMLNGAGLPHSRWMTDVVLRLRTDSLLSSAAAAATASDPAGGDSLTNSRTVIARGADGRPLIVAAEDSSAAGARLLFFSAADAGSLTSATLIAAVYRAISTAPSVAELEPESVPDSALARWQRAPAVEAPRKVPGGEGESDGRWLWIAVLVLMVLETVVRRTTAPSVGIAPVQVAHDRVA